jgi:hypothetical protein
MLCNHTGGTTCPASYPAVATGGTVHHWEADDRLIKILVSRPLLPVFCLLEYPLPISLPYPFTLSASP